MKKLLLSILASVFTMGMSAQTNLLENAGFEEWNGKTPTHWQSASTAGNATLSQSTDAHSGSYSVCVGHIGSANRRLAYKEITLKPGSYNFSFYTKAASADLTGSARPGYVPIDAEGKVGSYNYGEYTNDIAGDWVAVNYAFTLDAQTTLCLVVMNSKSGAGDLLIDDASLTTTDGGIADGGTEVTPDVDITNTLETAYSVSKCVELIDAGKGLTHKVYVKGIISAPYKDIFVDLNYGNATFFISDDGSTESQQFEIFRGYDFGGEKFTEEKFKVGDEVVFYGTLTKYKDTYETNQGAELILLNGQGTVGLSSIDAETQHSVVFDLAGRRAGRAQNGVFIVNGKKVIR